MLDDHEIARLVENYLPLVVKMTERVWLSARTGLTREDLISAGCFGLFLAARRFDPDRGVDFGVFARSHIHGALMREINSAIKAAGADGDDVFVTSEDEIEIDKLPDTAGTGAVDSAETAEVRELMEYVLTERERLALTLYYYEELTLAEIAAVLDESKSAIVRALKGALDKLKAAMAERRNA